MNQQIINPETANDLIIGYLTNSLTPEEAQTMQTWLSASAENQKQFADMQEIWLSAPSNSDTTCFDKEKAYQSFLYRTKQSATIHMTKRTPIPLRTWMYAAAMIALIFICGTIGYYGGKMEIQNKMSDITIEAPLGSKTKLYLPDGTLVWLNAGSKMTYAQNFGINDRTLSLSGEGYFEVTTNKELPFEVCTNELKVKVLGTKFNFRNYEEDVEAEVCLLEGKVALETNKKEDAKQLLPDQKAMLDKKTGKLSISPAKASYSAEWTNDFLYFDEELLPDIAKKLERSYNVKIEIADKALQTYRFYGNFQRREQSIQEIMNILSSTEKITYTMNGKNIVITLHK